MKLCIFSDIHGNNAAFSAALPLMADCAPDCYIFLGDLCGYYFDAIDVWYKLRTLPNLIALKGNHDDFFLRCAAKGRVPPDHTKRYGPSLELLLKEDPVVLAEFCSWLSQKKPVHRHPQGVFACFHGGPNVPLTEYIYPDSALPDEPLPPFVFLGHTHYAMFRSGKNVSFGNPGSLGQPRDGNPASFALFDTRKKIWELHHVAYDARAFAASLEVYRPFPDFLTKIFERD